jgi:hypothetical protein
MDPVMPPKRKDIKEVKPFPEPEEEPHEPWLLTGVPDNEVHTPPPPDGSIQ